MTPDLLITDHIAKDRFERLQTWMGPDSESEWFTIPVTGVGTNVGGVALRAVPSAVEASVSAEEIRVRTVLVVGGPEARVRIEATLTDGGLIVLRDAFGNERLQLLPGSPRLHADLSPGRYSVDAILPAYSRILFAITDGGRVRETRARVG
jgi:hypothetical protein